MWKAVGEIVGGSQLETVLKRLSKLEFEGFSTTFEKKSKMAKRRTNRWMADLNMDKLGDCGRGINLQPNPSNFKEGSEFKSELTGRRL